MDDLTEITLLEAYLDALRRDPNATVPEGLDPDFAEFVRAMVTKMAIERVSAVQARIWHKALHDAQRIRAARVETPTLIHVRRPPLRASAISLLAVLAASLVLVFLITVGTRHNQPTATFAPAAALPTGTAMSVATSTATTEAFVAIPTPSAITKVTYPPAAISASNANHLQITDRLGKGAIRSIAWSPDRTQLAVTSASGIWLYKADALDAAPVHLDGYEGGMTLALFSPDGATLASANAATVVLWNVTQAQAKALLPFGSVSTLTFSPDGTLLALGSTDKVTLWNMITGRQVAALLTSTTTTSLAFDPGGVILAIGDSGGIIHLWNTTSQTGDNLLSSPDNAIMKSITALAFSSDGKLLASGSQANWVYIWDTGSKALLHSRADVRQGILSLSFRPDGNAVAYGDGDSAWLWQFKNSEDPAFLDKATHWKSLNYALDGTPLALGYDGRVWRQWGAAPDPNLFRGFTDDQPLTSLTLAGNQMAAGEKSGVTWFWDTTSGLPDSVIPTTNSANISLSPDGKWLASGQGNTIQVWDWAHNRYRTLQTVAELPGSNSLGTLNCLAFSPDGRLLASGGTGNAGLILWDTQTWTAKSIIPSPINFSSSNAAVYAVAFSADNQWLVYRLVSHIQVWNVVTQSLDATLPISSPLGSSPQTRALAISPDGHLVAFADGKTIQLWHVGADHSTIVLSGHSDNVNGIVFSPDGHLIASASADGTLRLWEAATAKLISTLDPETGSVFDVAFSADGTRLFSASEAGVVYVWQIGR